MTEDLKVFHEFITAFCEGEEEGDCEECLHSKKCDELIDKVRIVIKKEL